MLKDIVVPTKTMKVGEVEFVLKGLTLTNLGLLLQDNYDALNKLMDGKVNMESLQKEYPEFIAKAVAMCAGESEEWEKVLSLPFGFQLQAFEMCWDLTIPDADSLGKLVARIQGSIPKLQEKLELG